MWFPFWQRAKGAAIDPSSQTNLEIWATHEANRTCAWTSLETWTHTTMEFTSTTIPPSPESLSPELCHPWQISENSYRTPKAPWAMAILETWQKEVDVAAVQKLGASESWCLRMMQPFLLGGSPRMAQLGWSLKSIKYHINTILYIDVRNDSQSYIPRYPTYVGNWCAPFKPVLFMIIRALMSSILVIISIYEPPFFLNQAFDWWTDMSDFEHCSIGI